jgi:hypothetical protein
MRLGMDTPMDIGIEASEGMDFGANGEDGLFSTNKRIGSSIYQQVSF